MCFECHWFNGTGLAVILHLDTTSDPSAYGDHMEPREESSR